jgi:hypothetical protein
MAPDSCLPNWSRAEIIAVGRGLARGPIMPPMRVMPAAPILVFSWRNAACSGGLRGRLWPRLSQPNTLRRGGNDVVLPTLPLDLHALGKPRFSSSRGFRDRDCRFRLFLPKRFRFAFQVLESPVRKSPRPNSSSKVGPRPLFPISLRRASLWIYLFIFPCPWRWR